MKILSGHISPETAYLVNDYPYGFRLRCKIRYWLETHPKHGVRFVSQTTNPKAAGEVWNKPKASPYAPLAGCMYLDDAGHVQWVGLSYYAELAGARTYLETYREGIPLAALPVVEKFIAQKEIYEAEKARGEFNYHGAAMVASLVGKLRKDKTTMTLEQAQATIRKLPEYIAAPEAAFLATLKAEVQS